MNADDTGPDVDLDTLAWTADQPLDPDYGFYRRVLDRHPGLSLDAGCGTGRLLLAYLRDGFRVEACDIDATMVRMCRESTAAAGFSPAVYHQAIQDLDTPNRYAVIYSACGTMMCLTDDADVTRGLERTHRHLLPGGVLAFNAFTPSYLHHVGGPLPTPWEPYYELRLPDGSDLVVRWRATGFDVPNQVVREECQYRLMRNGSLEREEVSPGSHRWWSADQLAGRLRGAGFADVRLTGDYGDEPYDAARHGAMCVVATRG